MDQQRGLYRVSKGQSVRRMDRSRLAVWSDPADAADALADPTLRAVRAEPPEGVATLGRSPATACPRLLPGGSGRTVQPSFLVHNSL